MAIGSRIQNVKDWNSARDDCIGDQRTMAAPWHRLCAHDGSGLEIGSARRSSSALLKFARLHVIGVSAEARVSPKSIPRISSSATAAPQLTESASICRRSR